MLSKLSIKPLFFNQTLRKILSAYAVLVFVVLCACNPTRDRRINREWHTMTGHFNVYFNGEQKFIDVMDALNKGHKDDFSRILEVFPFGDEAASKGMSAQLDEVMKKASLSIQNHNVGRYTDDSYYLMGRAQYYKRDYYAALEIFQYINSKYKEKGLRPVSTSWICKCYMGLQKMDEAEAVMGTLLAEIGPKMSKGKAIAVPWMKRIFKPIKKEHLQEIYATAADIAIKQERYKTAIDKLHIALDNASKKPDRIRYTYILGQLYQSIDSMQLSKKYFTKILSMLAPYEFEFNAILNVAKVYDVNDKASVKKIRRSLKRMLKDDKNDGMYDQIHYELGNLEYKQKNFPEAIKQYKLAAAKSTTNKYQKAMAYLTLATIYLEVPQYKLAQAYYDSTAATIPQSYKHYQKVIDKKNVLSELIGNYVIIETEDSLQKLSKLSKAEIEKKIDGWIASKKAEELRLAKAEKERKETEEHLKLNQNNAGNTNINAGFGIGDANWYFYNPTLMASGKADFFSQRKWGNRPNEDFWRYSAKEKEMKSDGTGDESVKDGEAETDSVENNNASAEEQQSDTKSDVAEERQSWIKDVPFGAEAFAKSNARVLDAYFAIGIIYDEKLLDYKEAVKEYEATLQRFPKNKYEPEILYRLYKDYAHVHQPEKALAARSRLISEYPESPFALILQNKSISSAETEANKEIVRLYEEVYDLYNKEQYDLVKQKKAEADRKFPGNKLQKKFELVLALVIGKTDSMGAFKYALADIVKSYPKTGEAEYAQSVLDYIKKQETAILPDSLRQDIEPDFIVEEPGQTYYYVFATKAEKTDMYELVAKINKYNDDFYQFDNLRANTMISNEGYQILMESDFKDINAGIEFITSGEVRGLLKKHLGFEGQALQFVISKNNFKKMLKDKKIDVYYKLYQKYMEKKVKKIQASPPSDPTTFPDNPDKQ